MKMKKERKQKLVKVVAVT